MKRSSGTSPATGADPRCRPATEADLEDLVALERESFPREDWFPRHQFRHLLRTPAQHLVLVPAEPGPPAGDAVVFFRKGSRTARLYNLVVSPSRRQAGLGARLMAGAEAAARARGCDRMILEVRETNRTAIHFYEKNGYSTFGRLDGFYPDGTAAVRMDKGLVETPEKP
jgi:[ribosomal protein S18]-alanine N-acetyltransferase